ncbi:unnamed protein product [Boreogadus saida]
MDDAGKSEKIEEDYCNPPKNMQKVSVSPPHPRSIQPHLPTTTEWLWYWEDDEGKLEPAEVSRPTAAQSWTDKVPKNDAPGGRVEFTQGGGPRAAYNTQPPGWGEGHRVELLPAPTKKETDRRTLGLVGTAQ